MNSKRVFFFETEPWEKSYIKKHSKGYTPVFLPGKLTPKSAGKCKNAEIISVFVYSDVSKKTLDLLPKVQCITTRSTGFDHIDIEECKRRGIIVSSVPFYGENTVAEHALALTLALSRRICEARDRVKKQGFDYHGLRGFDLAGKTMGIVGFGHIGQYVAKMAHGFGMKVTVFDVYRNEELAKQHNITYLPTLEKLLQTSDIITLHAPYNKHTHHLVHIKNVRTIKRGALLINTARGALIETKALLWALQKNILAGAGLDVLEEETAVSGKQKIGHADIANQNRAVIKHPNVIVTPHIAFNTTEAIQRILDTTVQNIQAFLKNKKLNRVC